MSLDGKPSTEAVAVGSGSARQSIAANGTGDSVVVPKRWRKLAAVAAPLWSDNNEVSVLSTLAPVIISALSLPVSAIGLLVSVSKAIGIFFGPLWSVIARRTNRKWVLVISTSLVGVATAATGLAQNFVQLLLLWSIAAVFVAAALPIVTEITADLFDEKSRGRANGYTWGVVSLLGSALGPLIGQLSLIPDGWRIGFFASGAIGLVVAVGIIIGFQDPGVGASEPALRGRTIEQQAEDSKLTRAKVQSLLKIPTFLLMLGQRLLAGHLLIATFGVLFLVETYGFTTAVASVVTLPFGIGYLLGTFAGGMLTDLLHAKNPRRGRIVVLQVAQFGVAAAALLGTQINWRHIGIFAVLWALMGFMQGINPGVNRPIVMAVVPPELRGAAFALMLSVFEALAYIAFNLSAGYLSAAVSLQTVMLWLPGILMTINGLYCTVLYRTYPRDVDRLDALLKNRTAASE
ncbi:MFS transporter [Saccharopolyspora sp. 5N102]|uniref:MFS transporter n=1 Tax=Saccharopolyspora sp. 5N102 TaxID=3375155 RepID=UPI0037BB4E97